MTKTPSDKANRRTLLRPMLAIARIAVAGLFLAHAVARIYLGTIPQFGEFLESRGFPAGELWVWAITATEIVSGLLLAAGRQVQIAASGLLFIAGGGIFLIHRHFGWFVGEHGTGGMEYSAALIVLLLIVIAEDHDRRRVKRCFMPS